MPAAMLPAGLRDEAAWYNCENRDPGGSELAGATKPWRVSTACTGAIKSKR